MNKMQVQLREFSEKFNAYIGKTPSVPSKEICDLRMNLINEEVTELQEALDNNDIVEAIDAICDIMYVVIGTAEALGFDIEPFFDNVHASNMSKVWPDGTVHYREDGKVMKPETYTKADIRGLLGEELRRLSNNKTGE